MPTNPSDAHAHPTTLTRDEVWPDGMLTTEEAGRIIGCGTGYVVKLIKHGRLRGATKMGRRWALRRQDVERYKRYRSSTRTGAWLKDMRVRAARIKLIVKGRAEAKGPRPTFVLPDVMRSWPILDDRDRQSRRGY